MKFLLAQWNAVPSPIREWLISQSFALWTVVVFAVTWGFTNAEFHDWPTFFAFLRESSFPLFIALVFGIGPYARSVQARKADANTVPVESGGSAILQPSVQAPSPQSATMTLVPKGP